MYSKLLVVLAIVGAFFGIKKIGSQQAQISQAKVALKKKDQGIKDYVEAENVRKENIAKSEKSKPGRSVLDDYKL